VNASVRGRRLPVVWSAVLGVALVGGCGGPIAADGRSPGATVSGGSTAPAPSTATVERRTLTIEQELDGTLGYEGKRSAIGQLAGILTWLPAEGAILDRGDRLYEVDGTSRAILLYGSRPAYRTLKAKVANGPDVRQLEENLAALGYLKRKEVDSHWDADTTRAVKRLQKASGQRRDGSIDSGEVVFLPGPVRVTARPLPLGTALMPGGVVLSGTGDSRSVTVDLAADRTDLLALGSKVTIELPDGSTTPGTVREIGAVATAGSDAMGNATTPTVTVTVTLDDPAASAVYANAPVTVRVVRETRPDVLAVPVNALVALLEGGYAVEVVADDGSTHLVGVELGIFQDGWVEVQGDLEPGQRVVIPS
jgi:peptidoglycan hydrolase-like protein with peptidoglycan-binding domain